MGRKHRSQRVQCAQIAMSVALVAKGSVGKGLFLEAACRQVGVGRTWPDRVGGLRRVTHSAGVDLILLLPENRSSVVLVSGSSDNV